jgi:hypothetical protein
MPLEEIAEVLGTDDLQARNQLITAHLERLERTLSATQSAVRSLRDLLGTSAPAFIELRSVAATRAVRDPRDRRRRRARSLVSAARAASSTPPSPPPVSGRQGQRQVSTTPTCSPTASARRPCSCR